MAHFHVAEHQPIDHGVLAATAAGLDAQAAVGVVHQALGHHHIFHAAAHLAANNQAAMAAVQVAVADGHILAGGMHHSAKEEFAGLESDAVIANMDGITDDVHILAAFGVNAVGVGAVGTVVDLQLQDVHPVRVGGVDGPGEAVAHLHTVQGHILGFAGKEEPRPPGDKFYLDVLVPVAVVGVGVDAAFAGDGHIFGIDDIDQTGKAVQRVSLPAAEIGFVLFIGAGQHTRQDGIFTAVGAAQQGAAFFQVQGGVAAQKQALGAVSTGGHIHRAARRAGGKRSLQKGGVVGHAVIHQAIAGSIYKKAFRRGGKVQCTGIAISGKHFQVVGFAGFQAEHAEHVGAAGFQHSLAVQLNPERGRGGIAGVVLQLKTGAAGTGTNESEFHTIISSIKNEKSFEIQQEMC